jgi:hypothetical protein
MMRPKAQSRPTIVPLTLRHALRAVKQFFGLKLIPLKQRCLIPPSSGYFNGCYANAYR